MHTKLYIPRTQSRQAKVIPLNASPLEDWITINEAAKLFATAAKPKGILPQSLKNKCWNNEIPRYAYTYGPAGWFFHKPSLMGLIAVSNPTAA